MPRNRLMRVMNNGPEAHQSPTGLLYNYSSFNTAKEIACLKLLSTRGGAKSDKIGAFRQWIKTVAHCFGLKEKLICLRFAVL